MQACSRQVIKNLRRLATISLLTSKDNISEWSKISGLPPVRRICYLSVRWIPRLHFLCFGDTPERGLIEQEKREHTSKYGRISDIGKLRAVRKASR